MAQKIYLVCGVPGSGKTWVCKQLTDKFQYVAHDDYPVAQYSSALYKEAQNATKSLICLFHLVCYLYSPTYFGNTTLLKF